MGELAGHGGLRTQRLAGTQLKAQLVHSAASVIQRNASPSPVPILLLVTSHSSEVGLPKYTKLWSRTSSESLFSLPRLETRFPNVTSGHKCAMLPVITPSYPLSVLPPSIYICDPLSSVQ